MVDVDKRIVDLIETVYLCGSGNADWQVFLDQYGALFPSLKSAMTGYDKSFKQVEIFCTSNYDLSFIDTYRDYYYKLNPWQDVILNSPLVPNVSWAPEVPLPELRRTEFYADWIRPQDNVAAGFTTMLLNEPRRFVNLTSNVNPKFVAEAQRAADALTIIGPHLQRAFELSCQLKAARVRESTCQSVLDLLVAPVFIVNANGKLHFSNAIGERLLRQEQIVKSDPGGRLCLVDARDHRAVMNAVRSTASRLDCCGPRFIPLQGAPKGRYLAFVTTLLMQRRNLTDRELYLLTPNLPIAVFIIDSSEKTQTRIEGVATALGVTPAEARLALALLHDKTLKEYADEQGVSIHTVRIQMRSLLDKTDTRRQAELVRLLANIFSTFRIT
jgi:DNA-binding CsgD family transcriptional regulator